MVYSYIFHIPILLAYTHAFLMLELKIPFWHTSGQTAKIFAFWKCLAQQENQLHRKKTPAERQQSNSKQDIKYQTENELLRS